MGDLVSKHWQSNATTDITYDIVTLTNNDPQFYPLIGPFLSRRDVVREVGGPLWDDDGMTWFVALAADQQVVGFIAVRRSTVHKVLVAEIDNSYVLPIWRGQGIYRALVGACLDSGSEHDHIRATIRIAAQERFARWGFAVRRQRGAEWIEVEKVKAS